jgi:hypothetical protein
LRRLLRSAERLSEAAIFLGSFCRKMPPSRSSASLSRVTRADQRRVLRDVICRARFAFRVLDVFRPPAVRFAARERFTMKTSVLIAFVSDQCAVLRAFAGLAPGPAGVKLSPNRWVEKQ